MAAPTQNPEVRSESKSAKKKKAKAEASVAEVAPVVADTPPEINHVEGANESPFVKELHKNIRSINKKITSASKVDGIIAENPGKSLDDLIAARKINADQKIQLEKKPALQAQLAQLQEQITIYKKLEDDFKARSEKEKAEFEESLQRANKEAEEKLAAATKAEKDEATASQRDAFLLLSQFLRLAAVRRGDEEADAELDENKAIEGVLSKVYAGDETAVTTIVNLIQGSEQTTFDIGGHGLSTTYAQVKAVTNDFVRAQKSASIEISEGVETSEYPVQSDPTIANAGLTELDEPAATALTNGDESHEVQGIPQNSSFGEGGNAAAEANWDNANDLSTSQEWVEVPRDAAETETGIAATPAAPSNVQSWADDQPDVSETNVSVPPPASTNDGFHEVQRSRGGNRGDGQRGGRGRGGDRGRGGGGSRGEFRGRGRGGPRGGAGGRGGRRPEES